MTNSAHFTPALFEFLSELADNNNREWFRDNKARYERDVRDALVHFVADFGDRLHEISPHMVADPRLSGGSIFRIYRDVRFSKDKSPYKTNAGLHFRHEVGRDVHGPRSLPAISNRAWYSAGAGIWRPNSATVGKIRGSIVANPEKWSSIVNDDGFASVYTLEGESLKRRSARNSPRPSADRPPEAQVVRSHYALYGGRRLRAGLHRGVCRRLRRCFAPFSGFLTRAVGLDW